MKKIIFIPCFILISLCSVLNARAQLDNAQGSSSQTPSSSQSSAPSTGSGGDLDWDDYVPFQGESHDNFDWSLVQLALLKPESNVIISPLSVKYLLVLLWEAASIYSNTKKELSTILPPVGQYDQRSTFGQIINSLKQKSDSYDLKFDTRIFVDQFIEPTQRFSAIAETYYKTLIERLDFGDAGRSADYINEWCSQATNGNVRNLVESNDLHNSVMLMFNAIYFKGLWRRPFPRNQTTELPFYLSSTQQIKTKYIVQTARYYYLDSPKLNSKILRIPYKGKKFSMIIALPNSKEGLGEFVRQLDSATLRKVEWLMDLSEVRVALPKFKFESTTNMNDLVKELGIQEIFTTEASLPLLAHGAGVQNQLRVSNITQKAGIQVDEEGSTVYAVTEIALVNKFGDTIKEFIADRPFLFFIQDETTGTLLFGGKVTNPGEFEIPE